MVDLYSATVDDYSRAALQSTRHFNFLKDGRCGTGPSSSVLRLRLASQSGNPSRVAKAVDDISVVSGSNTRVPHLDGEKVFGSAKRKLDLPPGDDSDSHHHDRVNYSVPKLSKGASATQCWNGLSMPSASRHGQSPKPSTSVVGVVRSKNRLPILESPCTDLLSWRIERISPSSLDLCRGHSADGTKCNAKIAKYRRAIAAPTFIGIQRLRKSRQTKQMQFWFCPGKLQACIKDTRSRSIVHYPALPRVWPIVLGTKLTQSEVDDFEALGFVLNDGGMDSESVEAGLPLGESPPTFASAPIPTELDVQSLHPVGVSNHVISDGDKRPKHRSGKLFRFVAVPSTNHILKMESSSSIECTILKSMKVPEPGYGIVFTVITPGSISKKVLYEVSISDFPACTCKGFRYICASALGNPSKKWIVCKHLYFILQKRMCCTVADTFIHCPGWTPNEVRHLMGRMVQGE